MDSKRMGTKEAADLLGMSRGSLANKLAQNSSFAERLDARKEGRKGWTLSADAVAEYVKALPPRTADKNNAPPEEKAPVAEAAEAGDVKDAAEEAAPQNVEATAIVHAEDAAITYVPIPTDIVELVGKAALITGQSAADVFAAAGEAAARNIFSSLATKQTTARATPAPAYGGALPPTSKFYTVAQVADLLSLTRRTILWNLEQGKLQGVKVGRGWRITPEALENFINSFATNGV